jgi:predicted DNA-binding transcriptional regulator YafY
MNDNQSSKAVNLLRIYNRLRQSPVTLDVLYQWTGRRGIKISKRSLYRYLDDLEKTVQFQGEKMTVYEGEKNKKVWKIEYDKSSNSLTQFDINTYYFIRNFIPQSLIGPRATSLEKFDRVIYEALSKSRFQTNVDVHDNSFLRSNYKDAIYDEKDHVFLEDIIWAIQNHRKIKVEAIHFDPQYFPPNFEKDILVCPIKLLHHAGLLYICTYSQELEKIVILPFNAIVESSITNIDFNPSKYQSDLTEYLANTFGVAHNYDDNIYDITIEVAGYIGNYISTMFWHTTQRFEELENGNKLIHLRCGINREILAFVLFFLNNVKVLKPLLLKEKVLETLQSIMDAYTRENLDYQSNYVVNPKK